MVDQLQQAADVRLSTTDTARQAADLRGCRVASRFTVWRRQSADVSADRDAGAYAEGALIAP